MELTFSKLLLVPYRNSGMNDWAVWERGSPQTVHITNVWIMTYCQAQDQYFLQPPKEDRKSNKNKPDEQPKRACPKMSQNRQRASKIPPKNITITKMHENMDNHAIYDIWQRDLQLTFEIIITNIGATILKIVIRSSGEGTEMAYALYPFLFSESIIRYAATTWNYILSSENGKSISGVLIYLTTNLPEIPLWPRQRQRYHSLETCKGLYHQRHL